MTKTIKIWEMKIFFKFRKPFLFFAWQLKKNYKKTIFVILLVAFGNILWFMGSVGSVWLLGETVAVFFMMLAILALENKRSPILVGIFLGIAFLSRIEIIVSLP